MVTRDHSYFQTKWLKYFKLTFITTLDSPYWNNQTMTKAIFYWVEEDKFCNDGPFILILLFLIPCFILMKFILSWHDLITVWFIGLDDPIITSIYISSLHFCSFSDIILHPRKCIMYQRLMMPPVSDWGKWSMCPRWEYCQIVTYCISSLHLCLFVHLQFAGSSVDVARPSPRV